MRIPFFFGAAVPGVEDTEAHLSVIVEVGIESNGVAARGFQIDHHRAIWIISWEVDIELEATIGIGGFCRSGY